MKYYNYLLILCALGSTAMGSTSSTALPSSRPTSYSRMRECYKSPYFGKAFELDALPFQVYFDENNTFERGELVVIKVTEYGTGKSYYKVGCFTGRTSRGFPNLYKIIFSTTASGFRYGYATLETIGKISQLKPEKLKYKQPKELE